MGFCSPGTLASQVAGTTSISNRKGEGVHGSARQHNERAAGLVYPEMQPRGYKRRLRPFQNHTLSASTELITNSPASLNDLFQHLPLLLQRTLKLHLCLIRKNGNHDWMRFLMSERHPILRLNVANRWPKNRPQVVSTMLGFPMPYGLTLLFKPLSNRCACPSDPLPRVPHRQPLTGKQSRRIAVRYRPCGGTCRLGVRKEAYTANIFRVSQRLRGCYGGYLSPGGSEG